MWNRACSSYWLHFAHINERLKAKTEQNHTTFVCSRQGPNYVSALVREREIERGRERVHIGPTICRFVWEIERERERDRERVHIGHSICRTYLIHAIHISRYLLMCITHKYLHHTNACPRAHTPIHKHTPIHTYSGQYDLSHTHKPASGELRLRGVSSCTPLRHLCVCAYIQACAYI